MIAAKMSGASSSDAERLAKFESLFTAGIGLVNSSVASELIENTVDTGLSLLDFENIMGIEDSGACHE